MSGVVDLAAEERAAEADRRYFEEHPDETERVRLAMPGELVGSAWVHVIQIKPGVRARRPWIWGARQ